MAADPTLDGCDLLVFDADGTLRRTLVPGKPCPHADDEWELLPGVRHTLMRLLADRPGLRIGVASNQDHVGYGLLDDATARRLLADAAAAATGRPAHEIGIELCPHAAGDGCGCRKPAPGMLRRLMTRYGTAPARTLFVGDAPMDREAAARAGVEFRWAAEFFGWEALSDGGEE